MTEERSPVGRLFGALVPPAVDAIDVNELIDRLDVEGLISRVDLEALLDQIDVDALVARIDIDRLLDRVDIDGIIRRVDLDALLLRIDLDALMERIDVNALVARIDLDALMAEVDMKTLMANAGIDEIVADATTGIAARTLDLARRQVVAVDLIILAAIDRILRHKPQPFPEDEISASGLAAGPVTRLLAFLADWFLLTTMFGLAVSGTTRLLDLFLSESVSLENTGGPLWALAFVGWAFFYFWVCFVIAGKTPGKALSGLRVVAVSDEPLSSGHAALRVLVFPFSFIFGLGFIPAVVRTDRRALHDLAAGSKEIIDWGDRSARLPSALEGWVERRRDQEVEVAASAEASPADAGAEDD